MAADPLMRITQKVQVGQDIEFDYLDSSAFDMTLTTVDEITVTAALVNRPDLISLRAYNSFDFVDLILFHNDITEPYGGLTLGSKIKIPSLEEYQRFRNRNRKRGTKVNG